MVDKGFPQCEFGASGVFLVFGAPGRGGTDCGSVSGGVQEGSVGHP